MSVIDENSKQFTENKTILFKVRDAKKMHVSQLATLLDVSEQYIRMIECGASTPSLEKVHKYLAIFPELRIEDFIELKKERKEREKSNESDYE